jgi:hypothetical protein
VAALAEDGDPVAHLDRLVDVVGDEHDRLADVLLEAEELVLEAAADDRVHGPEGLVHEHDRRVHGQGPGHPDPLALAARELVGVAVADLGGQADHLQQLAHPGPGPLIVPAGQLGHGGDVLADGAVREQADLLDDVADAAPQLGRVDRGHVASVDDDVAAGGLDHPVDHPQGGGLAAARGADQDREVTLGHLEGDVVDGRGAIGEALGDGFEADQLPPPVVWAPDPKVVA